MANAYKNKVVYDGITLIDLSDTTALAADVNSDKYFYLKTGQRVQGSQTLRTISETYSHISSTNTATKVLNGSPFYCDLQSNVGYSISSVTVTMGGVDITEDVFTPNIPAASAYSVSQTLTHTTSTNVANEVVEGGQLYCVLNAEVGYAISSVTVTMGGVDITSQVFTGYTGDPGSGGGGSTPAEVSLQTKSVSITPSETAQSQTVTADSGYDGLDEVEVNVSAISSTYVGSGIDQNDSTDLTASGNTVTAPAGYYASAASKSVASGSASTPATTISVTPSISVNSSGLVTASVSGSQNVTPNVSPGYVSSGTAGTVSVSGSNTSQLTTQGATTYNTSSSDQTINSGRYLTGNQTIKAVTTSGIDAANIKAGVTVKVGDSNDDDRIKGVTGTFTSDANATAADIASGKTAYVNGSKITGTASGSKNYQIDNQTKSRTANSYGDTGLTLTVAKTGTYTVTWVAWRGSSSGTMGTNLHVGNTTGTNQQTWTGTYGQMIKLTGQSYTKDTVLSLYATSGNNSRTIYVANLTIIEE